MSSLKLIDCSITSEEKIKHDAQFQFLKPINGLLTGEQAKPFFKKSGLCPIILGQIWHLADLNHDGKLDKTEFSIAMHLIQMKLEGQNLPFIVSNSIMFNSSNEPSHAYENSNQIDWSINNIRKPRYCLQFNQNDKNKKGYLTGLEVRNIFLKSGLSQCDLAQIWNLADIDSDGNLSCDEFCIAAYLIEIVMANRSLPLKLPNHVLDKMSATKFSGQQMILLAGGHNNLARSLINKEKLHGDMKSFEDKRKLNYLKGQIELERRRRKQTYKFSNEDNHPEKRSDILEGYCIQYTNQKTDNDPNFELEDRVNIQKSRLELDILQNSCENELDESRAHILHSQLNSLAIDMQQSLVHKSTHKKLVKDRSIRQNHLQNNKAACELSCSRAVNAVNYMRQRRDRLNHEMRIRLEQLHLAKIEISQLCEERERLSMKSVANVFTWQVKEASKALETNILTRRERISDLKSLLLEIDSIMTPYNERLIMNKNHSNESSDLFKTQSENLKKSRNYLYILFALNKKSLFDSSEASSAYSKSYTTVYAFAARHEDELSFEPGAKILVNLSQSCETSVEGWLLGEYNGKVGFFPQSYVIEDQKYHEDKFSSFKHQSHDKANSTSTACYDREFNSIDPFFVINNISTDPFKEITDTLTQTEALYKSEASAEDSTLFYCRAVYPYESNVIGDLSFKIGDIIRVFDEKESWWDGSLQRNHRHGIFPSNYVEKTSINSIPGEITTLNSDSFNGKISNDFEDATVTTKVMEIARVVIAYQARSVGQLSLTTGQLVQIRKKSAKGWWEGEIQQRGQKRRVGWFPSDYVRIITTNTCRGPINSNQLTSKHSSTMSDHISSNLNLVYMKALFEYKAMREDELSFSEGDLITVISKDEPDWWRGKLSNGVEGLFPVNYVRAVTLNSFSHKNSLDNDTVRAFSNLEN